MNKPLAKISLLVALAALLLQCASDSTAPASRQPQPSDAVQALLADFRLGEGDAAVEALFSAAELLLADGQPELARRALQELQSPARLPGDQQSRYALLQARAAQQSNRSAEAQRWLRSQLSAELDRNTEVGLQLALMLADYHLDTGNYGAAFSTLVRGPAPTNLSQDQAQSLVDKTWQALSRLESAELQEMAGSASSYEERGWIELARVVEAESASLQGQLDAIAQWSRVWTSHPALVANPTPLQQMQRLWEQRPRHIALMLPVREAAGLAIQEGFYSAYYNDLAANRDVPLVTLLDSSNAESIYPLYDEALEQGADLIIGPLSKQLVGQLARIPNSDIPILALNYADDSLGDIATATPEQFFQFGLAPEDEIQQITQLARDLGYRKSVLIVPADAQYERLRQSYELAWSDAEGDLIATMAFDEQADYSESVKTLMAIDRSEERASRLRALLPRNRIEFVPRRRQDIDFIYLVANPREARQINPTLAFYFAEDIPVFAYPSVFNGSLQSENNRDLDGIVFTDAPWLLQGEDTAIASSLGSSSGPLRRLRALGIDAYRLYSRLAQFSGDSQFSYGGTTGVLTLDSARRFRRNPPLGRFIGGQVEAFSPPPPTDSANAANPD